MKLGAFSVSLAVKDIDVSLSFYTKLGFKQIGGNIEENWVILKNETTVIGLFQGMFDSNILTFNPGWDADSNNIEDFDDIRQIEAELLKKGLSLLKQTEKEDGPDHIILKDPDGNVIMLDQHR
jgi:predicted lactoylglutathione lyase